MPGEVDVKLPVASSLADYKWRFLLYISGGFLLNALTLGVAFTWGRPEFLSVADWRCIVAFVGFLVVMPSIGERGSDFDLFRKAWKDEQWLADRRSNDSGDCAPPAP